MKTTNGKFIYPVIFNLMAWSKERKRKRNHFVEGKVLHNNFTHVAYYNFDYNETQKFELTVWNFQFTVSVPRLH